MPLTVLLLGTNNNNSNNISSSSKASGGLSLLVRGAGAKAVASAGSEATRCAIDNVWVQDSASLVVEGPSTGEPWLARGNVLVEGSTSSAERRHHRYCDVARVPRTVPRDHCRGSGLVFVFAF